MKEHPMNIAATIKEGLTKTRSLLLANIEDIFARADTINRWEEWEELLLGADMGYAFAQKALAKIREQAGANAGQELAKTALREALLAVLQAGETHLFNTNGNELTIIMAIGVNGTGKTSTIGKIGASLVKAGLSAGLSTCLSTNQDAGENVGRGAGQGVIFAAADTFRAAAIEQLNIWGHKTGIPVVAKGAMSDPAAVVYDAIHKAKTGGGGVLLIDTAGRMHTKLNLMEELKKIKRVIIREAPEARLQTLLVLDATTGQNAMRQAETFHSAVGVNAIALTKMDSSAKGGIIVRIVGELGIPIAYIGNGEKREDLQPFCAAHFVDALIG